MTKKEYFSNNTINDEFLLIIFNFEFDQLDGLTNNPWRMTEAHQLFGALQNCEQRHTWKLSPWTSQ